MAFPLFRFMASHKEKMLLLVAFFLVGALTFEAGILYSSRVTAEPLVLSIPAVPLPPLTEMTETEAASEPMSAAPTGTASSLEPISARAEPAVLGNCLFVGSKNSNKYHAPTCAVAKRIKPENRVCFASKEEAERRGYIASCLK